MSSDCHIVVCDDEADIRETFREYLALQGYRVSAAEGGGALRRLLETEAIDLVILDLSMPGEDGLSLARFLRERYAAGLLMNEGLMVKEVAEKMNFGDAFRFSRAFKRVYGVPPTLLTRASS